MKYVISWVESKAGRTARVYYQGWWIAYAEPLYSLDRRNALNMSRSGARKAVARLRDPKRWGVDASMEPSETKTA